MVHLVFVLNDFVEQFFVTDITMNKYQTGMIFEVFKVGWGSCAQVINDGDTVVACEQLFSEVRTDESGTACNQYFTHF